MKIYVDAEGFRRAAKEILIRAALRLGEAVFFVANKSKGTYFKTDIDRSFAKNRGYLLELSI